NELFRWAQNDAAIVVKTPARIPGALNLEVEPNPRAVQKECTLQVWDEQGRVVARQVVKGRRWIRLPLPLLAGKTEKFRLTLAGEELQPDNDPRILNFRVFHCAWSRPLKTLIPSPLLNNPHVFRRGWSKALKAFAHAAGTFKGLNFPWEQTNHHTNGHV